MKNVQALTVKQIKKLQTSVDKLNQTCTAEMKECELQRHAYLSQIGNILHPSVPISATEVGWFSEVIDILREAPSRDILVCLTKL